MKNFFRIPMNENRIFGLDFLRAAAIMFVVISHSAFLLPGKIGKSIQYLMLDGVTIFFVLSGFLIGGILIKEVHGKGISHRIIANFWVRRWFRTLPNYFLILVILTILHFTFNHDVSILVAARYYIFSQNLFHVMPYWFFPESWSLSIEEWFYILLPISFLFIIKFCGFSLKVSVLILIIFSFLGEIGLRIFLRSYLLKNEIIGPQDFSKSDYIFKRQVLTRFDSMMYGVFGAYLNHYFKQKWLRYKDPLLLVGVIVLVADKIISNYTIDFTGYYFTVFSVSVRSLGTFLLLPFLSIYKASPNFLVRKITVISIISYSMYLLNLSLIQMWIIDKINWELILKSEILIIFIKNILFWFLVFFLSTLLYKFYEYRMTSFRDKEYIKKILDRL